MPGWQPYPQPNTTIRGDVRVWPALHSPQLGNRRDVLVWLPPDYDHSNRDRDRRYPVFYLHDGQNVFDAHTAYAGEWEVDETMTRLAAAGQPAIIVALPNMGEGRSVEYCPYPFRGRDGRWLTGRGADYVRFLTDTVKPLIDSTLRTRPEAGSTGIAGSSMGGLISLYALLTRPDVFGRCGAFSTAYWFGDQGLLRTITEPGPALHPQARLYLDVGTAEGDTLAGWLGQDGPAADAAYVAGVRQVRDALLGTARRPPHLRYVEAAGAQHREAAWAQRLPDALRFLLEDV
ncbi:MAG: alpha/beta hydrolase-fold protein [Anaerolineae bacterium]|nr:alpha/beta hydrolase-fold protein [Anaerolineae bacterium]